VQGSSHIEMDKFDDVGSPGNDGQYGSMAAEVRIGPALTSELGTLTELYVEPLDVVGG